MNRGPPSHVAKCAHFLVIIDSNDTVDLWSRTLESYGEVTVVGRAGEAERVVRGNRPWDGAIFELGPSDAFRLELLRLFRRSHPCVPAIVASRALEPELINETYRLGAAFIVKPFAESYIDDFARSATRAQATLKALIDAWQLRYRLCNAEGDLLHAAANGEGREGAARRRACSPCTIKTHIANLLRKTGDASMNGAVIRLLREAAGLNGCDLVPES